MKYWKYNAIAYDKQSCDLRARLHWGVMKYSVQHRENKLILPKSHTQEKKKDMRLYWVQFHCEQAPHKKYPFSHIKQTAWTCELLGRISKKSNDDIIYLQMARRFSIEWSSAMLVHVLGGKLGKNYSKELQNEEKLQKLGKCLMFFSIFWRGITYYS